MATDMLQYLDTDGLDETVLNIGQIKTSLEGQISDLGESIEEELQNLSYARPDGIYPDMTVGAVIGADETAQWAQRESTGSGTATVRSVQGAAVAWNQMLDGRTYGEWSNTGNMSQTYDSETKTTRLKSTNDADIAKYTRTQYDTWGELQANRTYLYKAFVDATHCSQPPYISIGANAKDSVAAGTARYAAVILATTATQNLYQALDGTEPSGGYAEFSDVQLFDLTAMFGSGNEPQSVAEFEAMYPAAYYPYSAPTLKPVQIAGIRSKDAQGAELDAIEWTTQTLRAAGSVRDELTSDELVTRVGVVDLGTLNWSEVATAVSGKYRMHSENLRNKIKSPSADSAIANISCAAYDAIAVTSVYATNKGVSVNTMGTICVYDPNYDTSSSAVAFKTAMSGVYLYYELATHTTTPISPALPMSYKVQQGGSESVIVPDGEVSAAPVLTVAEPVNAGDEFARIWEAIQSLGYTRNAAQLSRPVSLTDIGSIDETQKDTAEIAEIDTTKEVQE